ncbi:hypothetical protein AAVH_19445 [Aphelenchoides avenae]|nr:hypothetical protein AAVH_19445 [Aphelenchus avenae]
MYLLQVADIKKNKVKLSLRATSQRPFVALVSATAMQVTTHTIKVLLPAAATSFKIDQRDTQVVLYPVPCTLKELLSTLDGKISAATEQTEDRMEVGHAEPPRPPVPAASGRNGPWCRHLQLAASLLLRK